MSDDYWDVIAPIWDDVNIYDGEEMFLKSFDVLTNKQQILLAGHWANSEIMNGGLGQFFDNSTGVLAPEAVFAFQTLGMPKTSNILKQAMLFFGDDYPRDRTKRLEVFEAYYKSHGENAVPMETEEDAMAVAIEEERGGFDSAADAYSVSEV
ncbi:DMP19 family protein [Marinicella rhabdoformis]|uniref:DMP19 family protein n=1 Tax=Marinicella rhabdoformis TaxID=2580566 RepID=UPI0012AEB9F8|nr:DUF4375 domain-containing protein [Marinicella rhabdoformis]